VRRSAETGTWHYGLIARYWDEFNVPAEEELAYYKRAIERFGQPALDIGCGTGRLLIPLARAGLAVDGTDVSADMIALCAARAKSIGLTPRLDVEGTHELDARRSYRTAFMCGVFGIGGSRSNDFAALRHVHDVLAPGGALLIDHEFPYDTDDVDAWARWLPGHRNNLPTEPSTNNERRRAADGDEIELFGRLIDLNPLEQRRSMALGARLWRGDDIVDQQPPVTLHESLYFAQEVLLLLEFSGFKTVKVEQAYSGSPATPEDGKVIFVATA